MSGLRDFCDLSYEEIDQAVATAEVMARRNGKGHNGQSAASAEEPEPPPAEADDPGPVATTERPRIELVTLDDHPPEPTRWLVDGLLPAESCLLLASEEKCGKSFLLFHLALCLASGHRVLDRWAPVAQGRTLIYSPESGWSAKRRRLWGLAWGLGLDPRVVLSSLLFIKGRVDLAADETAAELAAVANDERPALIIVDPLIAAHLGVDENSAQEVQPVLNRLRDVCDAAPGASLIVAHHVSKTQGRSSFHSMRGSTAVGAWSDGVLTLRRDSDEQGAPRRLEGMYRDEEAPAAAGFRIVRLVPPMDAGAPAGCYAFRLDPCEPPEKQARTASGRPFRPSKLEPEVTAKVLRLVAAETGELTRGRGADRLDLPRSTFNRHFAHLENLGKVRVDKRGRMVVADVAQQKL